jgi:hypothetical protein
MKKVFAILAITALASCGGSAETTEVKADTAVTAPVTVDTVAVKVVDSAATAVVDSTVKAVVDSAKK